MQEIKILQEKSWIDILSALLVPVVAFFGTIIALGQLWINNCRLRMELFKFRRETFEAIRDYISTVRITGGDVSKEKEIEFLEKTQHLTFIFGKDIEEFKKEVWDKAARLHADVSVAGTLSGRNLEENYDNREVIIEWFNKEQETMQDRFKKYLTVEPEPFWWRKTIKKINFGILLAGVCLGIVGCVAVSRSSTVSQVSTIDAILDGAYDGQMTCKELLKYGDFGIGTFDGLDGEMILLDGKIYQVKADGEIYMPPMNLSTPFASVVKFKPDIAIPIDDETDFKELEQIINEAEPNMNIFCALKVKGHFLTMKTRSVPAQTKPYPPLAEVTKNQPVFDMEEVNGAAVGFRCPAFVKGINVPGYHLHFLSEDLNSGGHILDFCLKDGEAEIDICNRFFLILPEAENDFSQVDFSKDRSLDLENAER